MGAKTWMLIYAVGDARNALRTCPALDRRATTQFASELFPSAQLSPLDDGDLSDTSPRDNQLCIGCFPGVSVVAAEEFAIDYPSKLPVRFIEAGGAGTVTLHAMHSVVDWFAFAQWTNRKLVRSLSLSPDSGILENDGSPLPFEDPYWAGAHPAVSDDDEDGYSLPFHPLELGEAALAALFGYQLEGAVNSMLFEPTEVPLMRFQRKRSLWKSLR